MNKKARSLTMAFTTQSLSPSMEDLCREAELIRNDKGKLLRRLPLTSLLTRNHKIFRASNISSDYLGEIL